MNLRRTARRHIHAKFRTQIHRITRRRDDRKPLRRWRNIRRETTAHQAQPLRRLEAKLGRSLDDNARTTRGDKFQISGFQRVHPASQLRAVRELINTRVLHNGREYALCRLPPPSGACHQCHTCRSGEQAHRRGECKEPAIRSVYSRFLRHPARRSGSNSRVEIQQLRKLAACLCVRLQLGIQSLHPFGRDRAVHVALHKCFEVRAHDEVSRLSARRIQS